MTFRSYWTAKFLVPFLIQKAYFADIKLPRSWALSINRDNILQLLKVFEWSILLYRGNIAIIQNGVVFTVIPFNERRTFWSSLLHSGNISQLSNCEIYDPFCLLDYASDSDSDSIMKLTIPLTSPILDFHLVASTHTFPTTTPIPTTSLVKSSLREA